MIAALPMYDWPEARASVAAQWAALRRTLLSAGIDAPESLVRRNGELPPVPGGIRDGEGRVVAPDPAILPPEMLDLHALWTHPALLLAQTCWGPMEQWLEQHVVVVGQPAYDGMEGGQGIFYSSAIVMRRATGKREPAPGGGSAILPLDLLRDASFAFNGSDSMSGVIALARDLEAVGEDLSIFRERIETGSHRASLAAVAAGRADVCAVDCRSWHMAGLYGPHASAVHSVGWTAHRKGLPYITSRHTPSDVVARLRSALA